MAAPKPERRTYPACCTAMFCGLDECPADCPQLPALDEFKAWVDRTNAYRHDPIWAPTVYTAIHKDPTP